MQKQLRVLIIVAAALILFSGVASAYDGTETSRGESREASNEVLNEASNEAQTKTSRMIDVFIDGKPSKTVLINTNDKTVAEILELAGIELEKDDVVTPRISALIKNSTKIEINKPFMVTVVLDGTERFLRTDGGTVKDIKDKIEEAAGVETVVIGAKETDAAKSGMTVTLVSSYTEKEEIYEEIPFEVVYVDNNELPVGEENVLTEGVNGVSLTVFELTYEGGRVVSRTPTARAVITESVGRVIERGAMQPEPVKNVVPTVAQLDLPYSRVITMRASAYTSDRGDAGTHTATGERARVGLVAVDPRFIPLGTMLYIEGYGIARAADTGGMIKGDAIDLFFNTYEECINFGRRNVVVYILEENRAEIAEKTS